MKRAAESLPRSRVLSCTTASDRSPRCIDRVGRLRQRLVPRDALSALARSRGATGAGCGRANPSPAPRVLLADHGSLGHAARQCREWPLFSTPPPVFRTRRRAVVREAVDTVGSERGAVETGSRSRRGPIRWSRTLACCATRRLGLKGPSRNGTQSACRATPSVPRAHSRVRCADGRARRTRGQTTEIFGRDARLVSSIDRSRSGCGDSGGVEDVRSYRTRMQRQRRHSFRR